jgi:hypothetical protein
VISSIVVGRVYLSSSGRRVRVLAFCQHDTSGQEMVIYQYTDSKLRVISTSRFSRSFVEKCNKTDAK